MKYHNTTGVKRLINACTWSLSGLKAGIKNETAFRQELILCSILLPLAFWAGNSGIERALLIGSLFLVLIVELLNSAVETAVDRIGQEHHPLSGRAKDLGSASVFVALINAALIWTVILFS